MLPAVALELGGIPEIAVERSPLARSIWLDGQFDSWNKKTT